MPILEEIFSTIFVFARLRNSAKYLLPLLASILLGSGNVGTGAPDGSFQWVRTIQYSLGHQINGVAADSFGQCYTVGALEPSFQDLSYKVFLSKHDANGNQIWLRQGAGSSVSYGSALAVDRVGNAYVAGHFSGSARFESTTLTATGTTDAFLAKYGPNGSLLWIRQYKGTASTYGLGVALDNADKCYLTGVFYGSSSFGSITLTNVLGGNQSRSFLAKIDSSGSVIWASSFEGSASGVGVDREGSKVFCAGGGFGYASGFVTCHDGNGAMIWFRQGGEGHKVLAGRYGDCYVSGKAVPPPPALPQAQIFVAKYDQTGNRVWMRQASSEAGTSSETTLALSEAEDCFIAGGFRSAPITFGQITLSNKGDLDLFVAKYDRDGEFRWAQGVGGRGVDVGQAIGFGLNGECYVAGHTDGSATFGSIPLPSGSWGRFLAKFSNVQLVATHPQSQTVTAGTSVTFTSTPSGSGPFTFRWRFNGSNILGASSSFLSISNAQPENAGTYSVVVTSSEGSSTSLPAFLVVNISPSIVTQPQSFVGLAGTNVTFHVVASGTLPFSYRWHFSQNELVDRTNSSLTLTNLQRMHAGDYFVTISNVVGVATSQVASIQVNYSLGLGVMGSGTIMPNPSRSGYPPDSIVVLTAMANPGHDLFKWSGDASGRNNPITIVMDRNKTVTANFVSTVLNISITGEGNVTKNPNKSYYEIGEQVTITATPARWYVFSNWSDGITANQRVVTIGTTNTYAAAFSLTSELEWLEFGGLSRLAPVGMPALFADDASNSQTNTYPDFTWMGVFVVESNFSARSSATVSLFSTFPNGTLMYTQDGSDPSLSASVYTGPFVLRNSVTLRAIAYNVDFTQSVQSDPVEIVILPTLSAVTAGGGSVTMDPATGAYLSNGTAVVTATPAPGWTFLQWLGDVTGTNPVANVSMNRNRCVQTVFGTGLSNTVVGSGSVARSPAAELYPYGAAVRITAVPQAGNYFALWANAASGTNNPLTFTVTNANPIITAVFAALPANQHALTVLPDGFGSVSTSPRANRYGTGTNVTLMAVPDAEQSFVGWSGDADGTQNPLTVTLNSSKVITAQFTKRPALAPILCGYAANGEDIQLLLTGEFGERYSIEATASFAIPPATTEWTTLATVTNSFGAVQFNDPFVTNGTQRFYRALRSEP